MTVRLRRLTHCSVPGHGTWCEVADEMAGARLARCTEESMALAYELAADELSAPIEAPGQGDAQWSGSTET